MKSSHNKTYFITFATFIFFFILGSFYFEYHMKVKNYLDEKQEDLDNYYNNKLFSLQDYSRVFLDAILQNKKVLSSFEKLSEHPSESVKNQIRQELFHELEDYYGYMKSKGVFHLHFHLPDGTSLLRMYEPQKYGDYLLGFRSSIKQVIDLHKPVLGYEIGKYFDGFRYVYPIMQQGKYLGSIEVSLSSKRFINDMNQYTNGTFLMILKKKYLNAVMDHAYVKKQLSLIHI